MTVDEILQLRLYSQNITNPGKKTTDILSSLVAIQAQDRNQAKFALGSRLLDGNESEINQAIEKRKIIRTWLLRGTLHFVSAKDIHWILDLISERILAKLATYQKTLNLSPKMLSETESVILKRLSGKKELTRAELFAYIEEKNISTKENRGSIILINAALKQIICLGKDRGKQETYTLLSDWVKKPKPIPREKALSELAQRYFLRKGPATLQDFIWWSGLTLTEARLGLEKAKPFLREEIVSGQVYWMSKKENKMTGQTGPGGIFFLAGFDEYIIGYAERNLFLDPEYSKLVIQKNAIFKPTILKDGNVIGTWNKTETKNGLEINVSQFFKWKDSDREEINRKKSEMVRFWSQGEK
ncbi:winged helix DNA-binding domain-containing protein [Leptospira ilyithenensis]|uniref:Winged helix DNA-binding domain-containing protein n=2 Tax=Leptospira ilyithenensis TaxID=2484901 RepID=A0A4R9LJC9_9LEPT|nr:winged helix DNA-binding domain-containing protein [Leptospira ilyithenensis]